MSTGGNFISSQPGYTFNFSERLGLVFIAEAACLSAVCVAGLLVYIAYSFAVVKRGASRNWTLSTHFHYYFINLLFSDLIQAIGGILDIRWIIDSGVTEGPLCTAQGIFKQMGDVGVALTSLAIAIHTFSVLVFRKQPPDRTAILVLSMIWIFIALVVGVSVARHKNQDYYGNTQYWCWITAGFPSERIALEYVWMWITASVNIICYIIIALVIKGVIIVEGNKMYVRRQKPRALKTLSISSPHSLTTVQNLRTNDIAMQMLFYPAVYTITVLPIAICRFLAFSGRTVPFPATAFSSILFSLSGVFNLVLFKLTRPKLIPGHNGESMANYYGESLTSPYGSQICYRDTGRYFGSQALSMEWHPSV
ncbi:hypothetical protein C8J56DRAFT_862245 [Mycena floridula]|nr:hypothetical protein C8J56DRAFT_862245 [Mycena floridula]